MQESTVHEDIQSVLFSREDIAARVREMGAQITRDYAERVGAGEDLVMVCLLRGAAIFDSDLARAVKLPVRMDYMDVSSYGNGSKSSGMVRIQKDLSDSIEGRHVIVVEDIIDSGLTLKYVCKNLKSRGPLSVEVAALLRKKTEGQAQISAKYVGFECPDEFIVGYGLDYAQRYRNFADICILKPEIYA